MNTVETEKTNCCLAVSLLLERHSANQIK